MIKHDSPAAFSIPAAATYLSISRASIYRLIKSGDLPRAKVGGRSLIRRQDADALLSRSLGTGLPAVREAVGIFE